MILRVLNNQSPSWSTVHNFKEDKTQISFNWGEDKNKEKIEFATGSTNNSSQTYDKQMDTLEIIPEELFEDTQENKLVVVEQIQKESETSTIKAILTNETEKALLLLFNGGSEIWIPKSLVHSKYNSQSNASQSFTIDTWILKKNKIIP